MVTLNLAHGVPVSTKGYKSFGINPHHVLPYNQFRFINLMKHAYWWTYGGTSTEIDVSEVDANGYPNIDGTFDCGFCSDAITFDDHPGVYKVSWDGAVSVSVSGAAISDALVDSGSNWFTFWMDALSNNGNKVTVTQSSGNRISNLAIVRQAADSADVAGGAPGGVHPGYQTEYDAGEVLLPPIKAVMSGYETIRSLWWCNEPAGDHTDWDTALPDNFYTYKTRFDGTWKNPSIVNCGVPYSVFVRICNDAEADPWICVPVYADDYYMTQLATLVRDNLDPGLMAKFEYTNEAWGFTPYQCRWFAWREGWRAADDEVYLDYVTDFSGWTAVGCTIGGDGVTITEDTSTGEHYIETTVDYGDTYGRVLLLLLDAATAPGVRIQMYDGTTTLYATFDLANDAVISSSGNPGYDPAQIHDQGAYKAMWTNGAQASGSSRTVRIQFTDASFATSYTGTSKTLTLKRAGVFQQTSGVYVGWYGKRAAQMRDIIDTVFSATGRPYRTIIAWQAALGANGANAVLDAVDWEDNDTAGWDLNPRTYEHGSLHDILSCATYMGNYNITGVGGAFSATNCRALWNAWYGSSNDENAAAFKALLDGYIVAQGEQLKSYISAYAGVAQTYGMGFEAYEGGNHCVLDQAVTNPLWNATDATGLSAASGALEFTISDSDMAFSINGDVTAGFSSSGVVKIDSEFLTHSTPTFDGTRTNFTVTYRAEKLSTAASHTAGATVTKQTYAFAMPNIGTTIATIMYDSDTASVWTDVLDHWKAEGGGTWCQLTDIMVGRTGGTSGWFGLRNYLGETNSVATAVEAWSAANPRWWLR